MGNFAPWSCQNRKKPGPSRVLKMFIRIQFLFSYFQVESKNRTQNQKTELKYMFFNVNLKIHLIWGFLRLFLCIFWKFFWYGFVPYITKYLCADFHWKRFSQSGDNYEAILHPGPAKIKNSLVQVGFLKCLRLFPTFLTLFT